MDNQGVDFEIKMDARELYKELLESKNELIQILREENMRLEAQLKKSE